ncbi:MAG: DNA repair protein RecN [Sporolactobacillus sp.]
MLSELQIDNFVIIEHLVLSFDGGMTVFTGETGAGKSIIIDAIALLTGAARSSSEYVRHGAQKAEIEGLFELTNDGELTEMLSDMDLADGSQQLTLRRLISAKGKSVCRVNGKIVTLGQLEQIGKRLLDFHNQQDQQLLLDHSRHLMLVDQFGGLALQKMQTAYQADYTAAAQLHEQCMAMRQNAQQLAQRLDMLRYQIQDIENAALKEGEEEQLAEEKQRLVHFEKIFSAMKMAYEALDGENHGLDWLRQAATSLESAQSVDPRVQKTAETVSGSYYELEEAATALRDGLEEMSYDPQRLDDIESRLSELRSLEKKYGNTVHDILTYLENIKKECDQLLHHDDRLEELQQAFSERFRMLRASAAALSESRQQTAARLAVLINRQLKDLCMEHARFAINVYQPNDFNQFLAYKATGADDVEFLMATNPGEPMKPLEKVASGGELSRVMLAIKSNFKNVLEVATIIFDEVDTGVSGRAAQAMAEKMYQLSKSVQVLCITHLPQVAAMADRHLLIAKEVTGAERTETHVVALDMSQRIEEIGRMISGVKMTRLTKQHASELLQLADKIKVKS